MDLERRDDDKSVLATERGEPTTDREVAIDEALRRHEKLRRRRHAELPPDPATGDGLPA